MSNTLPAELVGIDKISQRFDTSDSTIRRLIRRGDLPCYRVGGRVLIDPAEFVTMAARAAGRPEAVAA